jgi:uncharacterized protein (TIGR02145 family)
MKTNKRFLVAAAALAFAFFGCSSDDGNDGYESVVIGTQTWMKKNLNINAEGSKCYDDDPANCAKYGRLYDWETAMAVCPSGWHLPSRDEWETLFDFAGGEDTAGAKLKAASGWGDEDNSTDEFGFAALSGGLGAPSYDGSGFIFISVGNAGFWWSATETSNSNNAWHWFMSSGYEFVIRDGSEKTGLRSVRCLKD